MIGRGGSGLALTLILLAGCSTGAAPAPAPTPTPSAPASRTRPDVVEPEPAPSDPPADPLPAVGALFGSETADHYCTAAVVHSSSGAVVVTAAHCLVGSGVGLRFVPGYGRSGGGPAGSWTVTAAYAPQAWRLSQDIAHDYVFLRVVPASSSPGAPRPQTVEGSVGSVGTPGRLASGQSVFVHGYIVGHDDAQLSCTATTRSVHAQPLVDCPGFGIGSSGSPWLSSPPGPRPGALVGLIGGLQQGGCAADTSYSPTFDATATAVLARADAGGPGDTLPPLADDGC